MSCVCTNRTIGNIVIMLSRHRSNKKTRFIRFGTRHVVQSISGTEGENCRCNLVFKYILRHAILYKENNLENFQLHENKSIILPSIFNIFLFPWQEKDIKRNCSIYCRCNLKCTQLNCLHLTTNHILYYDFIFAYLVAHIFGIR